MVVRSVGEGHAADLEAAAEPTDIELEGRGRRVRDALLRAVAEAVDIRGGDFDPVALRTLSCSRRS